MNIEEVFEKLGIEKYAIRIFESNSNGELFHLQDYFVILDMFEEVNEDPSWFIDWFEKLVKYAEKNWDRPESVFQHVLTILNKAIIEKDKHNDKVN